MRYLLSNHQQAKEAVNDFMKVIGEANFKNSSSILEQPRTNATLYLDQKFEKFGGSLKVENAHAHMEIEEDLDRETHQRLHKLFQVDKRLLVDLLINNPAIHLATFREKHTKSNL